MRIWRAEGKSGTTASVAPGRLEGWIHVLGQQMHGEKCFRQNEGEEVRMGEGIR